MRNFGELCKAVAKEYGTGGRSISGGFAEYSPQGFVIIDYDGSQWDKYRKVKYTWADVARKSIELIIMDEY